MGVRETDRLCVQGGPWSEGETGVPAALAVEEPVSVEWRDVQEEDSDSCRNAKPEVSDFRKHRTSPLLRLIH